jgi:glycosyltransferase involved in cell wall biosynthesis
MSNINHTFIIPAYKNSVFIEDCIISLKQQTLPSNILITTSTASPFLDNIARKYNIAIHVNKNGKGIANDWNFAYKMCQTKYLTLAHQDDYYLPDYTERCLKYAEKTRNQDSLIIFTDYQEYVSDRLRKVSLLIFIKRVLLVTFLFKNNIKNHFIKRGILYFGNPISCPSVMFNINNIGHFEFCEEYLCNMDWDAWLRLANMNGKFIYVNKKLMVHRLHNESQTAMQIQNYNRYEEDKKIFQSIWNKPIAKLLMGIYKYATIYNMKKPPK